VFRSPLEQRILFRAVEIVGSHDRPARHLEVPARDLVSWMNGHDKPPLAAFLRCVDLIMQEDGPQAAQVLSEQSEPALSRRHER
jgi:hypothetical protein